jgi:hypothetical protein
MILHLGVIEMPYENEAPTPGKRRRKAKAPSGMTTGDVASILEDKYHVMEVFFQEKQQLIADQLAQSVAGTLESIMAGAPPTIDPFGEGTKKVKGLFDDFITNKEMDRLGYPGVPTKASLKGVSHRFKGKKGEPGRPSFVDTGLYVDNFTSWID